MNEKEITFLKGYLGNDLADSILWTLKCIPQVRCAIFGNDEEGVELVAHSRVSMRQISFAIKPGKDSISIVIINEKMHRSERVCGINEARILKEAIVWLKKI